jgi:uncharacterized protein (TIGR03067 family)
MTRVHRQAINVGASIAAACFMGLAGFVVYQKRFATPAPIIDIPESPVVLTRWAPDPKQLVQLGPEVDLDGYRVRPPAGYKPVAAPDAPVGMMMTAWAGVKRADGTRPMFEVTIQEAPPGETMPAPSEALDTQLSSIEARRTSFHRNVAESGFIGDHPFRRARWDGRMKKTNEKMHGFCYATTDGRKVVLLMSQDVEPHEKQSLAIAEAAAQTFRVASAEKTKRKESPQTSPVSLKELALLQGTWRVTAIEAGGKPVPADRIQKIKLDYIFSGDKVTIHRPDRPDETRPFIVNDSTNPKRMTIYHDIPLRAAYEVEGNILRLCMMADDDPDAGYPSALASKPSPTTDLLTLQRR